MFCKKIYIGFTYFIKQWRKTQIEISNIPIDLRVYEEYFVLFVSTGELHMFVYIAGKCLVIVAISRLEQPTMMQIPTLSPLALTPYDQWVLTIFFPLSLYDRLFCSYCYYFKLTYQIHCTVYFPSKQQRNHKMKLQYGFAQQVTYGLWHSLAINTPQE